MQLAALGISCLVAGVCIGILNGNTPFFQFIATNLVKLWNGIIDRLDKALYGNDGQYSSTRLTNMLWTVASIILVSYGIVLQKEIKIEILGFMLVAIGVSTGQNVVNKITEMKNTSSNNNGDNNETSN